MKLDLHRIHKIAAMPDLPMGDMLIVDRGGLGVDFRDRFHPEKGNLTFVNDIGADALATWLTERERKKKAGSDKESKVQKMPAKEIADKIGQGLKLVEAILGSSDLGTTGVKTVAKWLKIDPSTVKEVYSLAYK